MMLCWLTLSFSFDYNACDPCVNVSDDAIGYRPYILRRVGSDGKAKHHYNHHQRHHISEEGEREITKAYKKNKDKNIDKRLKALLLYAEGRKFQKYQTKPGTVSNELQSW